VILAAGQAGGSAAIASHHGQVISPAGYALLVAGPAALLGRRLFQVAVLGGAAGVIAAIRPARRAARLPVLRAIAAE